MEGGGLGGFLPLPPEGSAAAPQLRVPVWEGRQLGSKVLFKRLL